MKDTAVSLLRCIFWLLVIILLWLAVVSWGMISINPLGPFRDRDGFFRRWHEHLKNRLSRDYLIIQAKIQLWLARHIRD